VSFTGKETRGDEEKRRKAEYREELRRQIAEAYANKQRYIVTDGFEAALQQAKFSIRLSSTCQRRSGGFVNIRLHDSLDFFSEGRL
jgi:hypothetical protein